MHNVAHFLVYNVLAKFQLFCIITCRDILYFVSHLMTSSVPNLHNTKILNISGTRGDMTKRKMPFFFTFKGLSNKPFFFNSSIFHFIGTLNNKEHFHSCQQCFDICMHHVPCTMCSWTELCRQPWYLQWALFFMGARLQASPLPYLFPLLIQCDECLCPLPHRGSWLSFQDLPAVEAVFI